jgi:hypothetical protein
VSDSFERWQRRNWFRQDNAEPKWLRRLGLSLGIVGIAALLTAITFYYYPGIATRQLSTGRIYPINNHGTAIYLTKREWKIQRIAEGVSFVCIAGAVATGLITERYWRPQKP